MSCLKISNLHVRYLGEDTDHLAAININLELQEGEIFALIGESGSGKSTVAQSIPRLLSPPGVITQGQIQFGDVDLLQITKEQGQKYRWKDISFVFQSALNALNPTMTLLDHFHDTLYQHTGYSKRDSQSRAKELLAMVDLDPANLLCYPHELSGGMRQRAVIALALALSPKLILFDEPTTALDVIVEREIIDTIVALQKRLHFTALFISHDLGLMMEIADRFGVMKQGELVEVATNKQLQEGAQHPYTRQLIDALPSINGERKIPDFQGPQTPLLTINNLSKTFSSGPFWAKKTKEVLKNVNFTIHQQESLALVGASGSGKSTLGKIICGLLTVDGKKNPLIWNGGAPSSVQMIFQDPFDALNPVHTIAHHLQRALKLAGKPSSEVNTLLEDVGLTPPETFLSKFPHELSGGQRQRVVIARCLAQNPKLIVADEVTSMLDVSIRLDILTLLRQLQQTKQVAFLFITHDLAMAREFSQRIIVLQNGNIVETGDCQTVLENPKHQYSKRLIAAATRNNQKQENNQP